MEKRSTLKRSALVLIFNLSNHPSHHPLFHLQPLNGFLASRAEHDPVMQAADGASSAGQGGERGRGAHPCHGIGHCGEITSLIDSLDAIEISRVIGQV